MKTTIEHVHDGDDLTVAVTAPNGVQAFFDRVDGDEVVITIAYTTDDIGWRQIMLPIGELLHAAEALYGEVDDGY